MGISFLEIYGEQVKVVHNKIQLEEYTDFYGETMVEDMRYEIYTNGYGGMRALFIG